MKKLYVLIFTLATICNIVNGQLTKIGGGLYYGTGFHYNNITSGFDKDLYRSPFFGMYLKAVFETKSPVRISPSFAYFIPKDNKIPDIGSTYRSTKINEMLLNLDGNYVIISPEWMEIYGLGGINITLATIKWSDAAFSPGIDNALGLNIGAGINFKIKEKITLNSEARFILGKYHQLMINCGVLYNFSLLKKDMSPGK
jgi:opacity protein-like surface antigen